MNDVVVLACLLASKRRLVYSLIALWNLLSQPGRARAPIFIIEYKLLTAWKRRRNEMDARMAGSPSPPPEAPGCSNPGPRAAALQKVFAGALTASLKTNSYANFSSCFPTPAKHCPDALEGVWAQMNTRLEQECTREFEQILGDRQVVGGLNQWENLIEEARKRQQRAVEGDIPETP